jgi:hypothetical protein
LFLIDTPTSVVINIKGTFHTKINDLLDKL